MRRQTKKYRELGEKILEALGGEPIEVKVKGQSVCGMFIDALKYVEQWSNARSKYEKELRWLGLIPSAETMASALGMPSLKAQFFNECAAILFLGNAMFYEFSFAEIATYLDRGISVMVFNYPGYGKSQGIPTAASTCAAGERFYRELRRRKGKDLKIFLHGISLGGGIAANLMSHYSQKDPHLYLILDRSFVSMGKVAQDLFPVLGLGFLIRKMIDWLYPYPIGDWVESFGERMVIIRAKHDIIMAPYHAEEIANRAVKKLKGKNPLETILDVPGGHNHGDGGEACWLYEQPSQQQLTWIFHHFLQNNY